MLARSDVEIPLCVDLDGTLVRTDTLLESLLGLVRFYPWYLLAIPLWSLKGLAHVKQKIRSLHQVDVELLPYNADVLNLVKRERATGRRTVLVTASNQDLADEIAGHLQCFDEVYGTSFDVNLRSEAKARFLTERFGRGQYDYIGDSRSDIPVWRNARTAISVNAFTPKIEDPQVVGLPNTGKPPVGPVAVYAKTLRLHQWVKNVLVLVPLLTSHKIFVPQLLFKSLAATFAFCLLASATYIFNDLLDIESDRKHLTKRMRPIPSATISLSSALVTAFFLAGLGIVIARAISVGTLILCMLYVVCTCTYSLAIKRKLLLDTIMLAGLYTLRVLVGGAATRIPISFWLLAFSIFVFFSLAVVKRVAELSVASDSTLFGRSYQSADTYVLTNLGINSAFAATAIFALYINSSEVQLLYTNPKVLWLLCPVILYWFSRVWALTLRGRMNDDPVIFVLKDRVSYVLAAATVAILVAAKFGRLPHTIGNYVTF